MGLYIDSIYSMRWGILVFSICAILGMAYYGKDAFGGLTEGGFVPYNADSTIATTKMIATIGDPDYNDGGIIVLVDGSSLGWTVDMPQFKTEYNKVVAGFKSYKVRAVISYYEHPEQVRMVSDDRKKVLILGQPAGKPVLKDLLSAVSVSKLSVRIGGGLVAGKEMSEEILAGVETAEFDTLPIIFILLCLTLGGLTAGLTPWIVAALSIFGTLSILMLLNMGFRISTIASNVVTMFGLGLGIDYTLFIVSRFCYERKKHPNLHVSKIAQRTLETSGRTVLFSAVTVVLSLSGGLIFHEFFLSSMCLAVMLAAACASIGGVTVLLALLCIMDTNVFSCSTIWFTDLIYKVLETGLVIVTRGISDKVYPCAQGNATTSDTTPNKPDDTNKNNTTNNYDKNENIKNSKDNEVTKSDEDINSGFWFSIGTFVVNHPWPIVLLVSSFLISLTVVFFVYVQYGLTDPTVLHGASMARSVYSDIQADFSKYGHSNVYVYLETPPGGVTSEKFLRALSTFDTSLRYHQGVVYTFSMINPGNYSYSLNQYISIYANARAPQNINMTSFLVFPLALTDLKSHTYLEIALQYDPYTRQAKHFVSIVETLLAESFPAGVLSDSGIAGRSAVVKDLYADLVGTVPSWISVMMISIFVLLMIMTKSILIPIKAVVMSLLSLGATLGIIVLIFQKGGLQKQLDFIPNGYTDGSNLIFVFSVAFGLAVDYELFLISQVQENYQKLPDNKLAVTRALQQTGSVITSAAIMLALTTAAFLASTVSFIKLIGLGLAIAVIIDATVVRMFLVPATIVLFGDWNWWCPEPIKKAIDWLGVQETPDWLDKEDAAAAAAAAAASGGADGGECAVVGDAKTCAVQHTGNTVNEFDNLEKSEEKKDIV